MCYEVKCEKCGKTTWGGCGLHVASVYRRITDGQRCMCRNWPGVKLPQTSGGRGTTVAGDKATVVSNDSASLRTGGA
ncbi:hypothetical protein Cni_G05782 [Canna indica]|uniref:Uncharacterized protein n=1 Tax=Canna indica TaxID=4628 RepID=A0AAQ3Q5V0_9LILI|nr:hypothetical protein Cni_G05782 [Canna indica]